MTREPLVHFALLGALLFAARVGLAAQGDGEVPTTIEISIADEVVEAEALARQARLALPSGSIDRAALRAELEREESLLLDARALGLDRSDLVVRRRLAQKMEVVLRSELDPALDSEDAVADALERAIEARVRRYRVVERADE